MQAKENFNFNFKKTYNKLNSKACSNDGPIDEATFSEILEDEIAFLEDHNISTIDWDELKNTYINISKSINKNNHSWDEIIQALDKEYKYAEAEKKGIRFSRTGNNEYDKDFENIKNLFNNIPIEQLIAIFAKFSATENYCENVNFLNFQVYTGVQHDDNKAAKSPSRKEQAMAFYYLLKASGVTVGEIDKTKLAKFLHFLSGEEEPKDINASSIYKELKKLNTASKKRQNEVISLITQQIKPLTVQDQSGVFNKTIELLNQEKFPSN